MCKTEMGVAEIRMPSSYQASAKGYFSGSRADVKVPYREVSLSETRHSDRVEQHAPLPLYDTSGTYTDPETEIDLARGLPAQRRAWIEDRQDTKRLDGLSSEYGRQRQNDLLTSHLRFPSTSKPVRALRGKNVTQMHYARKGIITPEMEFIALRESMSMDQLVRDSAYRPLLSQHRGQSFGAQLPNQITPEFVRAEAAAGRAMS